MKEGRGEGEPREEVGSSDESGGERVGRMNGNDGTCASMYIHVC